jgi:lipid-A-disaccharide synthase
LNRIRAELPQVRSRMVLPNKALRDLAQTLGLPESLEVQVGGLSDALQQADLALASTGTVTLECAYLRVPTVAFYKTSFFTWQIAKRILTIKYGAMPNLLADEEIFPEFIQDAATADNIARAALELLRNPERRAAIRRKLAQVVAGLGPPGAPKRAAHAIVSVLNGNSR